MKKIERNDPCHCGSGKKYKKCCLVADETETFPVPFSTYNEEDEEDDYYEAPILSSPSCVKNNIMHNEDIPEIQVGLPFPEISEEDNAFLDKWYENVRKINNPIEELNTAIQFMDEHPGLVPAWGYEGEFLLDLLPKCFEKGYADEIYNLLIDFRKRFPGVYQREFGYYDSDLIYYSLLKDKKSDIPLFLDNFEKYPGAFPDKLFEVVNILATKGEVGLLIHFLKKVHHEVINSNEIIGSYEILTPLILHIEEKYIQAGATDNHYVRLCNEIREAIHVEIDDKFLHPEYWKQEHAEMYSEPGVFSCNVNKKEERRTAYRIFLKKFSTYLYQDITHEWVSADLISVELSDYISFTLHEKKVGNTQYFVFEKKLLYNYIARNLKNFLWIDTCKTNALLNGIWYFAQFLVKTGNATSSDMVKIQKSCSELHAIEQKINKGQVESAIFSKFPMY